MQNISETMYPSAAIHDVAIDNLEFMEYDSDNNSFAFIGTESETDWGHWVIRVWDDEAKGKYAVDGVFVSKYGEYSEHFTWPDDSKFIDRLLDEIQMVKKYKLPLI